MPISLVYCITGATPKPSLPHLLLVPLCPPCPPLAVKSTPEPVKVVFPPLEPGCPLPHPTPPLPIE